MKHFIWMAVIWTACNNTGDAGTQSNPLVATAAEKQAGGTGSTACNKLIFFQPGAEIYTKTYDGKGNEISAAYTKVLQVADKDGMTIAQVETADTSRRSGDVFNAQYSYQCDGRKIYMDLSSMIRASADNKDATIENALIEYPIELTANQTLPDASATMSMTQQGKTMQMIYHYKDRKVAGNEQVETPAGTWNCFKISNRLEVEMNIPGMDENTKKMMAAMNNRLKTTSITWFSPEFGIVQFELYRDDKLQLRSRVEAIKR